MGGTQKGQKSCLRVSKIDSTEDSALQEINWYLEVNKIGFTKTRTEIKLVPQGHRNRPHRRTRTAKIKLVPRGQQNRLHQNEAKNENLVPLGQQNRPHQRRHPSKREANKSQKESLKTEGQKAISYYCKNHTVIKPSKNSALVVKKKKKKKNYKTTKTSPRSTTATTSPTSQDYLK